MNMTSENHIVDKYVQHSKKLASFGQLQWTSIIAVILIILSIFPLADNVVPIIEKIVVWSATLAGITVTGYMGNSSIEKYAEKKFSIVNSTKYYNLDEDELAQG